MSSSTKTAILNAFLHIAAKKPLEKITVRDIVDTCGINRNTFYYYFQDIYAVPEEICAMIAERAPSGVSTGEVLRWLFLRIARFYQSHPRATRNITASLGKEGLERYWGGILNELILSSLQGSEAKRATPLLKTTVDFIRHAFLGIVIDWIHTDGSAAPELLAEGICHLSDGLAEHLGKEQQKV